MGIFRDIGKKYRLWKIEKDLNAPRIDENLLHDRNGNEVPFEIAFQATKCRMSSIVSYSENSRYYQIKGYEKDITGQGLEDLIVCEIDKDTFDVEFLHRWEAERDFEVNERE
jgi:hypothetical protein